MFCCGKDCYDRGLVVEKIAMVRHKLKGWEFIRVDDLTKKAQFLQIQL